jgi:hypothetical protein
MIQWCKSCHEECNERPGRRKKYAGQDGQAGEMEERADWNGTWIISPENEENVAGLGRLLLGTRQIPDGSEIGPSAELVGVSWALYGGERRTWYAIRRIRPVGR